MIAFANAEHAHRDVPAETPPPNHPGPSTRTPSGAPSHVSAETLGHVPAETPGQKLDMASAGPIHTDTERLGDEIARLSAHIHAATYRLLVLIRAFDEQEGWGGGFLSCAHWLSWRTGIAPGAAREKVRVARALASLPRLSEAMARGELSYSKVRALTRVARPANEAELLEVARHATAAHIERLVRVWRSVDRQTDAEQERERHQNRYLRLHPDDDGMWRLEGRLDPEVGALLEKALEWASDALFRQENASGSGKKTPFAQRRADALGLLAERWMSMGGGSMGERKEETAAETAVDLPEASEAHGLSNPPAPLGRADRFQVVVHVEADDLKQDAEGCGAEIGEEGLHVSAETSRRLACDASAVHMTHDANGEVLDVGRKTRTVPPAIRRALDDRDKGCRFPGCGLRYADAHHIVHWADGGETKLDNLVLLCRRHHRLVHEEGFRVELVGRGETEAEVGGSPSVRFLRPDGRFIPEVPTATDIPVDPVGALQEANADRGVHPGEWTPTPRWTGEVLDLDLALAGLMPLGKADP